MLAVSTVLAVFMGGLAWSGCGAQNLGALHLQAGNVAQAEAHLQTAAAAGEESSDMRNNLAVVHARSGRFSQAVVEARRALVLDPTNKVARDNFGRFQQRLESK